MLMALLIEAQRKLTVVPKTRARFFTQLVDLQETCTAILETCTTSSLQRLAQLLHSRDLHNFFTRQTCTIFSLEFTGAQNSSQRAGPWVPIAPRFSIHTRSNKLNTAFLVQFTAACRGILRAMLLLSMPVSDDAPSLSYQT